MLSARNRKGSRPSPPGGPLQPNPPKQPFLASRSRESRLFWMVICLLSSMFSLYGGVLIGWSTASCDSHSHLAGITNEITEVLNNGGTPLVQIADLQHRLEESQNELRTLKFDQEGLETKLKDYEGQLKECVQKEVDLQASLVRDFEEKHQEELQKHQEQFQAAKEAALAEIDKLKQRFAEDLRTAKQDAAERKERELQRKHDRELKAAVAEAAAKHQPHHTEIFDERHTGDFAMGLGFVDRNEFATVFDTGVPLNPTQDRNDKVLLLYGSADALPENSPKPDSLLSVREATANCHNLHVVLTQPHRKHQCLAVMGQLESFHVQRFMRVNGTKGAIDPSLPTLEYTSRGHQQNGRVSAKIPQPDQVQQFWEGLVEYLQKIMGEHSILDDLKPVLEKVSQHNKHNAVIVLVCNFGQSELLLNFVCNARAKGLGDILPNILLFATDQLTHELATSLGLTSVYLDSIFKKLPENAAKHYLDKTFREMMMAKVYVIQMVSFLGYDILFQDVDVVWYKNPLEFFHDPSNPHHGFDMYFQDDGNHDAYYAPYGANTGFYYVRNNERTRYFFDTFLLAGDKIVSSGSHQIPLIAHLSEHASLYGLRVKIYGRTTEEFPGGWSFHNRPSAPFLKKIMAGTAEKTYVFHMSWTSSKSNKLKFFQQMGEWYLKDGCVAEETTDAQKLLEASGVSPEACCAAEPIVTCHYRDKPSKIPCPDSDPIDKGKPSWW